MLQNTEPTKVPVFITRIIIGELALIFAKISKLTKCYFYSAAWLYEKVNSLIYCF